MTKSSQRSIITHRKELNMRNCDLCKEEIPVMHVGKQLGKLFVHQGCYNLVTSEVIKEWIEKGEEQIELESGAVGPQEEIIQSLA